MDLPSRDITGSIIEDLTETMKGIKINRPGGSIPSIKFTISYVIETKAMDIIYESSSFAFTEEENTLICNSIKRGIKSGLNAFMISNFKSFEQVLLWQPSSASLFSQCYSHKFCSHAFKWPNTIQILGRNNNNITI